MTGEEDESGEERVKLNVRVDERAKDAYEEEIRRRYADSAAPAGVVMEQELSAVFGSGEFSELVDATHSLAETFGEEPREKKISREDRGESVRAQYRISESTRAQLMEYAETADVTYARDVVERVMWSYAAGQSTVERATERIERVEKHGERTNDTRSAVERRADTIAHQIENTVDVFPPEYFDEVVETEATGISPSDHVRET